MALADEIAYYQRLLLFQYRTQPNALATMAIMVKQALMDDLAPSLLAAFNIDTAVGRQLDILGKYIGVSRLIGPPAAKPFFGFVDYVGANPQNDNGFTDYTDATINATGVFYIYQYYGTQNTALPDASYAFVLKLQIILNSNDGTLYSIQNYLAKLLPGYVSLVDNANMTMAYTVSTLAPVDITTITPFLPKPMGVGITVNGGTPASEFTRITSTPATRITSSGATRIGVIGS